MEYVGVQKFMKIHLSSTAFRGEDFSEKWEACQKKVAAFGWELGIQLHNSESESLVRSLAGQQIPLSIHAPLLQKKNWNLATAEVEEVFSAINENVELFRSAGVYEGVFHGGLMADLSPEAFGHGKSYNECMRAVYREELCLFPGKEYNRDFTDLEEYRWRHDLLKKNLARLRERFKDVRLVLENDFPAYGSMNMLFRDMVKLEHPLCLDTGHLWISCHLLHADFHKEVELAADSGLVRMCHFHESIYNSTIPPDQWGDGHRELAVRNRELDLGRVLRTLHRGGCELFVFEFNNITAQDLEIFHSYLHPR